MKQPDFARFYQSAHGYAPFPWQVALAERVADGRWPDALNLPTSSGKTAVVDVWLWAHMAGIANMPRRLYYVIDRRLLVDAVAARLMGFNVAAIAHLAELLAAGWVDPADIPVTLDGRPQPDFFAAPTAYLDFVPPDGWGHLLAARLPEQELVA